MFSSSSVCTVLITQSSELQMPNRKFHWGWICCLDSKPVCPVCVKDHFTKNRATQPCFWRASYTYTPGCCFQEIQKTMHDWFRCNWLESELKSAGQNISPPKNKPWHRVNSLVLLITLMTRIQFYVLAQSSRHMVPLAPASDTASKWKGLNFQQKHNLVSLIGQKEKLHICRTTDKSLFREYGDTQIWAGLSNIICTDTMLHSFRDHSRADFP